MEDKEDTQSSASAHLPLILPTVLDSDEEAATLSLTVASKLPAKPDAQTTVEAPTRNTRPSTKAGRLRTSGSGGREDCWSDSATSSLINAWGRRFLELSRGNLKQKHWQEVADVVSSRDDYTRSPKTKTDVQCKNRIDTLKKKYKVEKSKICSNWPFFQPLNDLIGGGGNPHNSSTTSNCNGNKSSSKKRKKKARTKRSKMDLRFELQTCKKKRSEKKMIQRQLPEKPMMPPSSRRASTGYEDGLREMVKAVVKVSEIYERVERSKLEQIAEMEKQRMKFTREMELQRMRFFMKSQLELTQLSLNENFNCRKRGSEEEDRDVGDNEPAHAIATASGDSNNNNNRNTDSNSNNKSSDSNNKSSDSKKRFKRGSGEL